MNKFLISLCVITLIACNKKPNEPTITSAAIGSLDCNTAKITGTIKVGELLSNVSATISYTEGNGETYKENSYTSTGVTGLIATIPSGTLSNGNGVLTYYISGAPSASGTASFAISIGDKSCTLSVNVSDSVHANGYGPDIKDIEGNTYKTVYIGTQHWMAENLYVGKYNDGMTIANVTDNNLWATNKTGAWSTFVIQYAGTDDRYGKLYNWYAVNLASNGNKNVCPTGWHVPTDAEWTVLTDYLGGEDVAGGKLKEEGMVNWYNPNTDATNSSLFTAMPGGYRNSEGDFGYIHNNGYWWSATQTNKDSAQTRVLSMYAGVTIRREYEKSFGMSIRCLKD